MDRKSRMVLSAILKCQLDESEDVYVDYDNKRFLTVSDGTTPANKIISVPFKMSDGEVRSVLENLSGKDYIRIRDKLSEYVCATHSGVVFPSVRLRNILRTAVFSFLIPSAVAYVTSAFSHYVEHGTHLHTAILEWILSFCR